jgi:hypothetical protein
MFANMVILLYSEQCPMFFLLFSCQPNVQYTDQWTSTQAVCDFQQNPGASKVPAIGEFIYPSEECIDAVITDFKIDAQAFQADEGFDSIYGHVNGAADVRGTKFELVLLNARALLQSDLGLLSSLRPNDIVTEDFLKQMETVKNETDVEETAGLFYNFASSIIQRTIPGNKGGARVSFAKDQNLIVSKGVRDQYVVGTVLVHESRHRWLPHQACQWDQTKSCDTDPTGAYGYGMAAKLITMQHSTDLEGIQELDQSIRKLFNRIESFNTKEGELIEQWQDVDLMNL